MPKMPNFKKLSWKRHESKKPKPWISEMMLEMAYKPKAININLAFLKRESFALAPSCNAHVLSDLAR